MSTIGFDDVDVMNSKFRKNTIVLNLRRLPTRPAPVNVHVFIRDELHLSVDQVECLQFDAYRGLVFVKVISNDLAQRKIAMYSGKLQYKHDDNKLYDIDISGEDDTVTVRVHNVSYDEPNSSIVTVLSRYGTVIGNAVNETWGKDMPYPVLTGVRAVKMKLLKPIPSFIEVNNQRTLVTYPGQVKTCMICSSSEHFRSECTQKKSVAARFTKLKGTFSDVVSQRFGEKIDDNMQTLSPAPAPAQASQSMLRIEDSQPLVAHSQPDSGIIPETQVVEDLQPDNSIIPETQEIEEHVIPSGDILSRSQSRTQSEVEEYSTDANEENKTKTKKAVKRKTRGRQTDKVKKQKDSLKNLQNLVNKTGLSIDDTEVTD